MSYKLHCPECRTVIPPENINVQQTIAVCANCAAVFNFADKISTGQKIKRRKIKKPDNMTQTETEHSLKLETLYLQTPGYKMWTRAGILLMGGLYSLMLIGTLSDGEIVPAILFSVMFLPIILWLVATLFATQTVEISNEDLKHEVRWGGMPFHQRKMSMDDVLDINLAETMTTAASTAEARYNIYADKYDGRQDMFITNLPEEMAIYTQQTLSSYVRADTADDGLSRLEDAVNEDAVLVEEQSASQVQGI